MRSGITMKTDDPTPEETVAAARRLLNSRIEELQRANGITEHSDLNIATAVKVIKALTTEPSLPRRVQVPGDRAVMRSAAWHDASLLSQYLDSQSPEFQRDVSKYGVYVIFELIGNEHVPLFVEATPKYIGMSTVLSSRLKQHAAGTKNSNPAIHVTQEYLLTYATVAEQAAYAIASLQEQQKIRRLCMERRRLWVRTAHTEDKREADRLEHALIRYYQDQGYMLWNDVLYTTGT